MIKLSLILTWVGYSPPSLLHWEFVLDNSEDRLISSINIINLPYIVYVSQYPPFYRTSQFSTESCLRMHLRAGNKHIQTHLIITRSFGKFTQLPEE